MKISGNFMDEAADSVFVNCEILGIMKNQRDEWVCEIAMKEPRRENFKIRGVDRQNALDSALLYFVF